MSIVLASASPRRLALLEQIGVRCQVLPVDTDESLHSEEDPADYVVRLAVTKAVTAAALIETGDRVEIGRAHV